MPKRAKPLENELVDVLRAILKHQGSLKSDQQVDDGETFFTIADENGVVMFLIQILAYDLRDDTAPIGELNERS